MRDQLSLRKVKARLDSHSFFELTSFAIPFFVLLTIVKFDPDPHHDGIQIAPAIGILNHLDVHGQLFEQYGPIWDWMKYFSLLFFGPKLLVIRVLASVIISVTCFMIFKIIKRFSGSVFLGSAAVGLWLFTCPAVNTIDKVNFPLWPWPSLIVNLAIVVSAEICTQTKSKFFSKPWNISFALGLCSTIAIFSRLQVGLLLTIIIAFILYRNLPLRSLYAYIIANLFFCMLVLFYLAITASIKGFFLQIVSGPLNQYVSSLNLTFILQYFVAGSIPSIFFILVLFWLRKKSKILIVRVALLCSISSFLMIIFGKYDNFALVNRNSIVRGILDVQSHSILYFGFLLYFSFLVISLIKYFIGFNVDHKISKGRLIKSHSDDFEFIFFLFSICAVVQLYPIQDIYHIWWASPIIILWLSAIAHKVFLGNLSYNGLAACLTIPIILLGIFSYFIQLQVPRTEWKSGGVLQGMQISNPYFGDFLKVNDLIQSVDGNTNRYFCPDGLFAVWTGQYLSQDGNYVSWSWGTLSESSEGRETKWILCSSDDEYANWWISANGLKQTKFKSVRYVLSPWSFSELRILSKF